jgi:hypothetical protein
VSAVDNEFSDCPDHFFANNTKEELSNLLYAKDDDTVLRHDDERYGRATGSQASSQVKPESVDVSHSGVTDHLI